MGEWVLEDMLTDVTIPKLEEDHRNRKPTPVGYAAHQPRLPSPNS